MRVFCQFCDNADVIGDRLICRIRNEEVYEVECDNYDIEGYINYCKTSELNKIRVCTNK